MPTPNDNPAEPATSPAQPALPLVPQAAPVLNYQRRLQQATKVACGGLQLGGGFFALLGLVLLAIVTALMIQRGLDRHMFILLGCFGFIFAAGALAVLCSFGIRAGIKLAAKVAMGLAIVNLLGTVAFFLFAVEEEVIPAICCLALVNLGAGAVVYEIFTVMRLQKLGRL